MRSKKDKDSNEYMPVGEVVEAALGPFGITASGCLAGAAVGLVAGGAIGALVGLLLGCALGLSARPKTKK
jgi:hypothetical protein